MKDLLIIAGVGFLVYHYMSSKAGLQSNPTVDTTGTTVASNVGAPVPMPGLIAGSVLGATSAPAATSGGTNPSMVLDTSYSGPASLGSDLSSTSGSDPSVLSPSSFAFDRADYVNPFSFTPQMVN
jgi:hypothetical protein